MDKQSTLNHPNHNDYYEDVYIPPLEEGKND